MYLKSCLTNKTTGADFSLSELIGCEFDVILVEPPLHEYQSANGVHFDKYFSWDEVHERLKITSIIQKFETFFLSRSNQSILDL